MKLRPLFLAAAIITVPVQGFPLDVDPTSGASSLSYELDLPKGRNGFTPTLSLRYHSNGGQSAFGYGFSFNDPTIRRSTEHGVPSYDDGIDGGSDEFFLDAIRLVKVGAYVGAIEYRPIDDDKDTQILRVLGEPDVWRVRTSDGIVQWFDYEVTVTEGDLDPNSTSRTRRGGALWKRTRQEDPHGNLIEYWYDTPALEAGVFSAMFAVPVLTRVGWGANLRVTPEQYHVYTLDLVRRHMPNPFPGELPENITGSCFRGAFPNFRYGTNISEIGSELYTLVRAAVVQTAAPGTTDGTAVERSRRISSVYHFSYNWDRVGCQNYDEIWPLLEKIDHHAIALDGSTTRAPTLSMRYNNWARSFSVGAGPDVPSSFNLNNADTPGANLSEDLSPYLALSAPNTDRALGLHHLSARGCRLDYFDELSTIFAAIGHIGSFVGMVFPPVGWAIQGLQAALSMFQTDMWLASCRDNDRVGAGQMAALLDVQQNGTNEFVDLQECTRSGLRAHGTPYYSTQYLPFAHGKFGTVVLPDGNTDLSQRIACGLGVGVRMATHYSPPGMVFNLQSLLNSVAPISLAGDLVYNRPERSQYRKFENFMLDVDGDADQDIVTGEGWYAYDQPSGTFAEYPSSFGFSPWANLDYVWRHLPIDEGRLDANLLLSGIPLDGDEAATRLIYDRRFSPSLQDGGQALLLSQSYAHTSTPIAVAPFRFALNLDGLPVATASATNEAIGTGLAWSSSVGDVRDYTGDGLPDRLATVRNGAWIELVLYEGTGPLSFAPGRVMFREHRSSLEFETGERIPVSAGTTVSVGIARIPGARTIPVVGDVQTDSVVDINGDGLPDLVSGQPRVDYLAFRSSEAGASLSVNPFAFLRGSSGGGTSDPTSGTATPASAASSAINLRMTVANITNRVGTLQLGEELKVLWNRGGKALQPGLGTNITGQSFLSLTAYAREREDTERCASLLRINCVKYGTLRVEKRGALADYNGDGLIDLVYPHYFRPNLGGTFGPPQALDASAQYATGYGGFMEVALTDSRQTFHATKQMLMDADHDGRVDAVWVGRGTPTVARWVGDGHIYAFPSSRTVDTTNAPAGRLMEVDGGDGTNTRVTYALVQSQRADNLLNGRQTERTYPRHGWVVERIQTRNVPYAQQRTRSFQFFDEVYRHDPLAASSQPSLVGYRDVRECDEERGVVTHTHRTFDQVPSGLVDRTDVYIDPSDLTVSTEYHYVNDGKPPQAAEVASTKHCFKATTLALSTQQAYATQTLGAGSRGSYRRSLLSSVVSSAYLFASHPAEGGSGTITRADAPLTTVRTYEYLPNTTLVSTAFDYGDVFDPADDTHVEYEYDEQRTPERYLVRAKGQKIVSHSFGMKGRQASTLNATGDTLTLTDWASASEPRTTEFTYDGMGNTKSVKSPAGRKTMFCYDQFSLVPVATFSAMSGRVESVVDYATGAVLEQRGPVGLAYEAPDCLLYGEGRGEPSFKPRRTDEIPLDKQQVQATSRTTEVPHIVAFGGNPGAGAQVSAFVEHPHSLDRLPVVTAGNEPTPIPDSRFYSRLTRASMLTGFTDSGVLASAPNPARALSQPAQRVSYDGLGRVLNVFNVARRTAEGEYLLAEVQRHRYHQSIFGLRVLSFAPVEDSTDGTLDEQQAPALQAEIDGLGQVHRIVVPTERGPDYWTRYREQLFAYDNFGSVAVSVPSPANDADRATQRVVSRDALFRPFRTMNALGALTQTTTRFASLPDGRPGVIRQTTHEGITREEASDLWGRPVYTKRYTGLGVGASGDALTTSYLVSPLAELLELRQSDGLVTQYEHDWFGRTTKIKRLASEASPAIKSKEFVYDLDGALVLTLERDADGTVQTTVFVYDSATGQLVQKVNPAVTAPVPGFGDVTYAYHQDPAQDGFLQLRRQCAPTGCVKLTYDAAQRVATRTHEIDTEIGGASLRDSYGFAYEYTATGAAKRIIFKTSSAQLSDAEPAPYFELRYDTTGAVSDVLSRGHGLSPTVLAHLERTLSGHIKSRTDGYGGREDRTFTALGQLQSIELSTGWLSPASLPQTQWTQALQYYPNGLLRSSTLRPRIETAYEEPAQTTTYTYDGAGRLRTAMGGYGYGVNVSYQRNRTRIDKVTESILGSTTQLNYVYGDERQPTAVTALINGAGLSAHTASYRADGASTSVDGTPESNDPLGTVRRVVDETFLTDVNEQRSHFYDGGANLYATVDSLLDLTYKRAGQVWERQSTERLASLSGAPFARVNDYGAVRFMHHDAQGNVVLSRGDEGQPIYRFEFSPHGTLIRQRGFPAAQAERRGFQGALADVSRPGVWNMGARDYRPAFKMWTSIDPAALELAHSNPHQFAADNPLMFSDLSGLQEVPNTNMPNDGINELPPGTPLCPEGQCPTIYIVGDVPRADPTSQQPRPAPSQAAPLGIMDALGRGNAAGIGLTYPGMDSENSLENSEHPARQQHPFAYWVGYTFGALAGMGPEISQAAHGYTIEATAIIGVRNQRAAPRDPRFGPGSPDPIRVQRRFGAGTPDPGRGRFVNNTRHAPLTATINRAPPPNMTVVQAEREVGMASTIRVTTPDGRTLHLGFNLAEWRDYLRAIGHRPGDGLVLISCGTGRTNGFIQRILRGLIEEGDASFIAGPEDTVYPRADHPSGLSTHPDRPAGNVEFRLYGNAERQGEVQRFLGVPVTPTPLPPPRPRPPTR